MTRERYHPIIYVRGFAMRDSEIEATINTPYMGFNLGATRVRQGPSGAFDSLIFESPVIRLMKDHGYRDVYAEGAEREDRLPRRTLNHRYKETQTFFGASFYTLDVSGESPLITRKVVQLNNDYIHQVIDIYHI